MRLKAPTVSRKLHPLMARRAAAVKAAHADLSANHPTFSSLKPHQQFRMTQQHARRFGGCK